MLHSSIKTRATGSVNSDTGFSAKQKSWRSLSRQNCLAHLLSPSLTSSGPALSGCCQRSCAKYVSSSEGVSSSSGLKRPSCALLGSTGHSGERLKRRRFGPSPRAGTTSTKLAARSSETRATSST